jgi:hypothetical protein
VGDDRRAGRATDHPQQGVPTDGEAKSLAQSRSSRPPEREAHGEEACRQSQRPPRPGCHNTRQSLGEDTAGADDVAAEQLTDTKPPHDLGATPRQVGQRPEVVTMDVPGRDIAPRAAGFRLCGRDQEGDLRARFVEVPGIEVERDGVGQDMGQRVSNLHRC